MAEKPHCLVYENNLITLKGVAQVVEITEKEGQFKLGQQTVVIKGGGLNVVKLDKDQGVVCLEVAQIVSITYKSHGSLKGLFK